MGNSWGIINHCYFLLENYDNHVRRREDVPFWAVISEEFTEWIPRAVTVSYLGGEDGSGYP